MTTKGKDVYDLIRGRKKIKKDEEEGKDKERKTKEQEEEDKIQKGKTKETERLRDMSREDDYLTFDYLSDKLGE